MVLARFLATLLFEVSPTDPASSLLSTLLLLKVAVVASSASARRAFSIDLAAHAENRVKA
jgi:hypothetical protein